MPLKQRGKFICGGLYIITIVIIMYHFIIILYYIVLYNNRFVNFITKKELNEKTILSHIQNLRINYLKKNIDLTCDNKDSLFIPNKHIENNLEKLSKLLKVNTYEEVNVNLSKEKINHAADLFFALNFCPSEIVRLYWRVMYGNKQRIAIMASNIIKKVNDNLRIKALKIFAKVTSVLGFQYITNYPAGNQSFLTMKTELGKNILGVKGKNVQM